VARRCIYGLAILIVAGCAKPELATGGRVDRDAGGGGGTSSDLSIIPGGVGGNGSDAGGPAPSDLSLGQMCTDGGMCSTGNPGDCSSGHVACSGLVASCVPDVTTQRCYTGPAGTVGVGACQAGMQTCIGALGSCAGEVTPAAVENCFNDVDDDCDGVVNNGCPTAITTGTPAQLTPQGSASGSNAFSLRCPANSYITSTTVYGDDNDGYIAGIDITCATPTLVRGASAYTVTPTVVTPNPASEHAGSITLGDNFAYSCGTTSFTPGFYVQGYADNGIDDLGLSCATTSLALSAANKLSITLTQAASQGVFGFAFGSAFEDDCPADSVLIGYDGRDQSFFNQLIPVCAPLQVVYK
jgi:hypothetical protein